MLTGECSFDERLELNRKIRELKNELEDKNEELKDAWAIIEALEVEAEQER